MIDFSYVVATRRGYERNFPVDSGTSVDKENCEPIIVEKDGTLPDAQPNEVELPLDASIMDVLGDDPTASQALDVQIHPTFVQRWKYWLEKGFQEEEKQNLLKKYHRPAEFDAPILNPEIVTFLGESACKRDTYRKEAQLFAGSALTAIGDALTMCSQDEEGVDKLVLVERLFDAAKLIAGLHHNQSACRKAFILPGLSKEVKTLLQHTAQDTFLFGDKLGDKIKEMKSLERVSHSMKVQPQALPRHSSASRQPLNFRGPWRKRPFLNNMGHTNTFRQAKPQLFFKNRFRSYNSQELPQRTNRQGFRAQMANNFK